MRHTEYEQHGALDEGLDASLAQWWASLFEATSRLSTRQLRQLSAEQAPRWEREAACAHADPESWFPPQGSAAAAQVFKVCARCPVRRSCLAAALSRHEHGVWAGTTEDDRRELQQRLRLGEPVSTVLDTALAAAPVAAEAPAVSTGREDAA